ncbi:MAG TPA: CoA ester lyase [Thermoanaerobaculaceae bacterium]|nr:CoA ester lyase [Thermoanaerobaculaceae bacterium]HRS17017.1 CoA ester lyase [Thermoanaerobaculaceae bacterium]
MSRPMIYPEPPARPVHLERSMLFVPASRYAMIEKAAASAADAVCIDLEDALSLEEKVPARANVVRALREIDFGPRQRMYRINGLDTPFAYRDIIEVVEEVGDRLDLLVLPKANRAADVQFVDRLLSQIEAARGFPNTIMLEVHIETAQAFLAAAEIAAATPRLDALIFGPGDYAASIRAPLASIGEEDEHDAVYPGHRWHAVMHTIVAAARANGLRCMDGPFAGLGDAAGLERAARIARAIGFDGKQCIHPAQLEAVNRIFTPPAEEVAWAERVLAAYEAARAAGRGVVAVDGKMVDAANLRMARVTVERHRLIEARQRR